MDCEYLDKQKILDWLTQQIKKHTEEENKSHQSRDHVNALICRSHRYEADSIKDCIEEGDFDAVPPKKPEQQEAPEVRVGDVRKSVMPDYVYTITAYDDNDETFDAVNELGNSMCDSFSIGDELLFHSDNWAESINWMMNHEES